MKQHLFHTWVELDLIVREVLPVFGPYVKYIVSEDEEVAAFQVQVRNAFDVMHQQQINDMRPDLPQDVEEKTRKDMMHSSLLHLL